MSRRALDVSALPTIVYGPRATIWWAVLGLMAIELGLGAPIGFGRDRARGDEAVPLRFKAYAFRRVATVNRLPVRVIACVGKGHAPPEGWLAWRDPRKEDAELSPYRRRRKLPR